MLLRIVSILKVLRFFCLIFKVKCLTKYLQTFRDSAAFFIH